MRINIECGYVSVREDRSSALSKFWIRVGMGKEATTTIKEMELRKDNLNRIKRK